MATLLTDPKMSGNSHQLAIDAVDWVFMCRRYGGYIHDSRNNSGSFISASGSHPDCLRMAFKIRKKNTTLPPPLKKNPSNLTTNQDGSHHDICHVIVVAVVAVVAVVVDVFLLLCFLFLLILLGWIFID